MRTFLCLLAVFCFLASVQASVSLVTPVSTTIRSSAPVLLGGVMPGETLELSFAKSDGQGGFWNNVELLPGDVPGNWKLVGPEIYAESMVVKLSVPGNETEHAQTLRFRLSERENPVHSQEITLQLRVRNDLLKVSVVPLTDSIPLGATASYKIVLVNDSLASHTVQIGSSLPQYWFEPLTETLPPKPNPAAVKELTVTINPKTYGARDFSFFADSKLSQKRLGSFREELTVEPTLRGKFQAGLFGYSFFSPTLSPFYFFNALLGSLRQ